MEGERQCQEQQLLRATKQRVPSQLEQDEEIEESEDGIEPRNRGRASLPEDEIQNSPEEARRHDKNRCDDDLCLAVPRLLSVAGIGDAALDPGDDVSASRAALRHHRFAFGDKHWDGHLGSAGDHLSCRSARQCQPDGDSFRAAFYWTRVRRTLNLVGCERILSLFRDLSWVSLCVCGRTDEGIRPR